MLEPFEVEANIANALCIVLAGRRNVHTWWTGIVASVLFGWVFMQAKLYADAGLQVFFVVTGGLGWWRWVRLGELPEKAVTRLPISRLLTQLGIGVLVTALYAWALWRYTDAAAPLPDAAVLTSSVLGQLLLVEKRVESWYFWLAANTISVPLYLSRGLYLTAALYCCFWVNAIISLRHWKAQANVQAAPAP
jgi:nicotinamide mononucleotide transporter